jgi:hypothetical protein
MNQNNQNNQNNNFYNPSGAAQFPYANPAALNQNQSIYSKGLFTKSE